MLVRNECQESERIYFLILTVGAPTTLSKALAERGKERHGKKRLGREGSWSAGWKKIVWTQEKGGAGAGDRPKEGGRGI